MTTKSQAKKGSNKDLARYCELAVSLGAVEAKPIPAKSVVTAPWVRMKCLYGCGGAGARKSCPPHSPTPEQTQQLVDSFTRAILIHVRDGVDITKIARKVEIAAFLGGYYKAWAMGAGPCMLCEDCDPEEPCLHPDQSRPAMEACGVDVFQTVRNNGFKIEVLTSHDDQPNFFGLVLID